MSTTASTASWLNSLKWVLQAAQHQSSLKSLFKIRPPILNRWSDQQDIIEAASTLLSNLYTTWQVSNCSINDGWSTTNPTFIIVVMAWRIGTMIPQSWNSWKRGCQPPQDERHGYNNNNYHITWHIYLEIDHFGCHISKISRWTWWNAWVSWVRNHYDMLIRYTSTSSSKVDPFMIFVQSLLLRTLSIEGPGFPMLSKRLSFHRQDYSSFRVRRRSLLLGTIRRVQLVTHILALHVLKLGVVPTGTHVSPPQLSVQTNVASKQCFIIGWQPCNSSHNYLLVWTPGFAKSVHIDQTTVPTEQLEIPSPVSRR